MNPDALISIVVPFFNERENVALVGMELKQVLEANLTSTEVILIDDGSDDGTAQALDQLASDWPQCQVHHFRQNRGQSAALLYGFSKTTGSIIVTMDGDGQNDPHDIPKLLDRLSEADMVVGTRLGRQDSWARRTISGVANLVRAQVLGDGMSDAGCALKVFRREVTSAFIPLQTLYSFMPALAVAAGFRVTEEPVQHRPRRYETSKYSVRSFLIYPIIDLIGLRWFRARRCRNQPSQQERWVAPHLLGVDLYGRSVRRGKRRFVLVATLAVVAGVVVFARGCAASPQISFGAARQIALRRFPQAILTGEELRIANGETTWIIDLRPQGSRDLYELGIAGKDSRVIAERPESGRSLGKSHATFHPAHDEPAALAA
ncbi:MAG: glycosyltransferase family 2 protein [Chthoniobacterales bacterium]|nr:glycosyltransferase family 2 protein [Chthoniobacterales bacterium]